MMSSFITTSIEYMNVKEYLAVDSSHEHMHVIIHRPC